MTRVLVSAAFLALGVVVGISLRDREPASSDPLTSLDYYTTEQSFSEIENTKALLSGLLQELRGQLVRERLGIAPTGLSRSVGNVDLNELIRKLQNGIAEFSGTDQQTILRQDLLHLLKATGQYEQWLLTYFSILYTCPTNELVVDNASDAIIIGRNLGRSDEVIEALRHVAAIPIDFDGKDKINKLLLSMQLLSHVAVKPTFVLTSRNSLL